MTELLGQLLTRLPEADILAALRVIDEKNIDGYIHVLSVVKQLPIVPSTMTISLDWVTEDDGEGRVDIIGIKDGQPDQRYAIEFTAWEKWLASPFEVKGCDLTEAQIAAWCLWEMTFIGWNQEDIQSKIEDIHQKVDDIKNMIEDE